MPTVAVLGASNDRSKYGNKCVRAYLARGWAVLPINLHHSAIEGLAAYRTLADAPGPIDRVSLYLQPDEGLKMLEDVRKAAPKDFFVNPGAESDELIRRAKELNLPLRLECAIVAIGESPGRYP